MVIVFDSTKSATAHCNVSDSSEEASLKHHALMLGMVTLSFDVAQLLFMESNCSLYLSCLHFLDKEVKKQFKADNKSATCATPSQSQLAVVVLCLPLSRVCQSLVLLVVQQRQHQQHEPLLIRSPKMISLNERRAGDDDGGCSGTSKV